jgi:hypothetical protein
VGGTKKGQKHADVIHGWSLSPFNFPSRRFGKRSFINEENDYDLYSDLDSELEEENQEA